MVDPIGPDRDEALSSSIRLEAEVAELRLAVAFRDNFLALVAHELRNPMTPILAQVQRLKRLAGEPTSSAAILGAATERAERLVLHYIKRVTMLLDVTRMNAGKLHLQPEHHDLVETARHVVESLAPAAAYAGCAITLRAPSTMALMQDRLGAEQILENLVSNAVKYGGGSPVTVSLVDDGSTVSIEVADQGPGISADNRDKIFERFERVLETGSTVGGFGVGLWVVRQLAEAMGGGIEVSSPAGGGATFRVMLPREAGGSAPSRAKEGRL
jgi:two-component system, OmpR family, sensor kinase